MLRIVTAIGASIALALSGAAASAQSSSKKQQQRILIPTKKLPVIVPQVEARNTLRMTTFDPERHGFNFGNRFRNNFISEFDVRTGGLCGGMVYTALDYWKAGKPIPQQTWLPTEGSTLQSYIYNRQVLSIVRNGDRWAELAINPFGERNNEFWRWGMEGKQGGQIEVLKRYIDAGNPVPLSMRGCGEDCSDDHQILAIGYDMGRYKGDLGQFQTDFKIFVYDPNRPNVRRILRSDPAKRKFYFEDDPDTNWRTYFVDTKWQAANPPTIATLERELLLTFETGEDDLSSNVQVTLRRNNGRDIVLPPLNNKKRWITNSTQTVPVSLPAGTTADNITGIRIWRWGVNTGETFGTGVDNWDLRRLLIRSGDADGKRTLFTRAGSPLHRFTKENHEVEYSFGTSAGNELIVTFYTGSDDLRGGNDNADFFLTLHDGRSLPFRNVNEGRKWENGATITRYLTLPSGVSHSDIKGARIVTRFSGGVGGDNWNLDAINVKTREGGMENQLFYAEGDDGPLHRFTAHRGPHAKAWTF
ncbi:hypothetical protein ACRAQ6_12445 [Erythrobacter sp. HA6-11]